MTESGAASGDRAAGDRLAAFLDRLDRVGLEDLRLLALPLPEPEERAALLAEVDRAATASGRAALVEEARTQTRTAIDRAYARHQYEPTWAGLNWGRSLGTTRDRLGLALAAEDAAVAEVMRDLLDEDTLSALSERYGHAAGMSGSTSTPSLAMATHDRTAWLVWGLLASVAILVMASYLVGFYPVVLGLGLILVVGIASWRRRAA